LVGGNVALKTRRPQAEGGTLVPTLGKQRGSKDGQRSKPKRWKKKCNGGAKITSKYNKAANWVTIRCPRQRGDQENKKGRGGRSAQRFKPLFESSMFQTQRGEIAKSQKI